MTPNDRQLDQTQRLLGAVMGQESEQTGRFGDVREALAAGKTDIVVELPWYPDGGTHQIIIRGLSGDRVTFVNPLGHEGHEVGSSLTDGGLARRVEPDHSESALVKDLEKLFAKGKARALIPR